MIFSSKILFIYLAAALSTIFSTKAHGAELSGYSVPVLVQAEILDQGGNHKYVGSGVVSPDATLTLHDLSTQKYRSSISFSANNSPMVAYSSLQTGIVVNAEFAKSCKASNAVRISLNWVSNSKMDHESYYGQAIDLPNIQNLRYSGCYLASNSGISRFEIPLTDGEVLILKMTSQVE
jgi:hypothetical protein